MADQSKRSPRGSSKAGAGSSKAGKISAKSRSAGSKGRSAAAAKPNSSASPKARSRSSAKGGSAERSKARSRKPQATKRSSSKAAQGGSRSSSRQPADQHHGREQSTARENGNASSRGLTAAEAVAQARAQLSELLGRPVEAVLGVDRDDHNWVVAAEVVELARIPNTTDVLGLYRAAIDDDGEMLSFSQVRRYHRGHTTGGES
jgi:Gas vesicle synthesis protein GvpO